MIFLETWPSVCIQTSPPQYLHPQRTSTSTDTSPPTSHCGCHAEVINEEEVALLGLVPGSPGSWPWHDAHGPALDLQDVSDDGGLQPGGGEAVRHGDGGGGVLGQHQLLDEGCLAHPGCTRQKDRVVVGHQQVQEEVVAFHLRKGMATHLLSILDSAQAVHWPTLEGSAGVGTPALAHV